MIQAAKIIECEHPECPKCGETGIREGTDHCTTKMEVYWMMECKDRRECGWGWTIVWRNPVIENEEKVW